MGIFRVILCIIFPPLAVVDKGCGSFIIVFILTCLGWIPGVIAALIINNNPNRWNEPSQILIHSEMINGEPASWQAGRQACPAGRLYLYQNKNK